MFYKLGSQTLPRPEGSELDRHPVRVVSAETQDNVSEPQWIEEENEEVMEELSFIPSAVREPRGALQMFPQQV